MIASRRAARVHAQTGRWTAVCLQRRAPHSAFSSAFGPSAPHGAERGGGSRREAAFRQASGCLSRSHALLAVTLQSPSPGQSSSRIRTPASTCLSTLTPQLHLGFTHTRGVYTALHRQLRLDRRLPTHGPLRFVHNHSQRHRIIEHRRLSRSPCSTRSAGRSA